MGSQPLEAVAFDIDGTLYPESVMYLCAVPAFFRDPVLMKAFGQMRRQIRTRQQQIGSQLGLPIGQQFRQLQAVGVLDQLGRSHEPHHVERMARRIDRHIYRLWEKSFALIRPYKGVVPLFSSLKKEHVKTALLSDFPPGVKPKALKISEFVDITLCAEDTGRLKPDPTPFEVLTEQLRVSDPAGILYVGNSYDKDIIGAKGAGLRTAYIVRSRKRAEDPGFIREHEKADIIFSNYRQLSRIIDSMERAGISW